MLECISSSIILRRFRVFFWPRQRELGAIDLNLLVVFDAVSMKEVTLAATARSNRLRGHALTGCAIC